MIESALGNMFEYTASHNEELRAALPLHEAILVAIRRRNPTAARRAVRALLADTSAVISKPRKSGNAARARQEARRRSA
jgi:DNA-binding FadR family transcriptional regulator